MYSAKRKNRLLILMLLAAAIALPGCGNPFIKDILDKGGDEGTPGRVTRTAGIYVGSSTVPEPGISGLVAGLTWISSNEVDEQSYRIVLDANETVGPQSLTTGVTTGITIILEGVGAERIIQLSSNGSLFTIPDRITLVLDKYITLRGAPGNNNSLVRVNTGGNLEMREDAKITGNTHNSSFSYGGGVYVDGGTFTMNDSASVSGNTATTTTSFGGGVSVAGGTFIMNDSVSVSNNTAFADGAYNRGGGVNIMTISTLTMNGGTIYGSGGGPDANKLEGAASTKQGISLFKGSGSSAIAQYGNGDLIIPGVQSSVLYTDATITGHP
ncbi:hypothetical protein AGMMS49579_07120 [Spirochaetia bacterium]|nr:hypothetical protein AGMMS49579_07120 [Spirochaetia bacterium]